MARSLGFYGDGISFPVVFSQSFWLRVLPGGARLVQPRWMPARRILGGGRTCGVSFWPFPNSSGWCRLISSVFLTRISCHKTTHANGYYAAWPGWKVSISVLPLTEWGRCPGKWTGYPFQYSCLGNPTDRGAWWAGSDTISCLYLKMRAIILLLMKGCCWPMKRCWDSWPPEEKNSIRGQRRGLIAELLCNKVLLTYKGDRESFWHRHQKGAERVLLAFSWMLYSH